VISYEYPLNERIRTLLRLEDLYDKARYFTTKVNSAEHHVALLTLFEILEVSSRADLKSDLLQELERQKHVLEALRHNPAISEVALQEVLSDIELTSTSLLETQGKIGQHLRENEWLMAIKQRTSIPGGVCEFDLPAYHYWLHHDPEARRKDLSDWLAPMLPVYDGLSIVLRLLRDSGKSTGYVAHQGVFQQAPSGRLAQMLRITLTDELPCVPEISANKYALNIRFLSPGGTQRPKVCEVDVHFELMFCNL
jgi:cell division protein ZapD